MGSDDALPSLADQIGANLLDFLFHFRAVLVVKADGRDMDELEPVEQFGEFGVLFLDEVRGQGDDIGGEVDLDVFAA